MVYLKSYIWFLIVFNQIITWSGEEVEKTEKEDEEEGRKRKNCNIG